MQQLRWPLVGGRIGPAWQLLGALPIMQRGRGENMKEKKSYVWAAMSCSLVIHLAIVPWAFEAIDTFFPKGWWSTPLHCSMAAIFIFTLICLAAFIDYKMEDK